MTNFVDLRSDTVTRPTAGMREAIAGAVVGDDVLGDDPTVKELEARIAAILGKEAAVFMPSGIMANQTALALLPPATEVICEGAGHIYDWENGAPAFIAAVQLHPVATSDGLMHEDLVRPAIRAKSPYQVWTSAIELENTHNGAGGRILPLERMQAIRALADEHGLRIHLDGARLWHASEATGVPEKEFAACADTVMVALSKGLGCPVGSVLAGTAPDMLRARGIRRRLGGSMRQSGILAAAGLYALAHHRQRLGEDHRRARLFAELLSKVPGLRVIPPDTNIIMIDILVAGLDAPELVRRVGQRGVGIVSFTRTRVRAVTHLDVDDAGIETAAQAIEAAMLG
ncbi:MAG: aminotransferase class I/II-fold pyridoxal phosphate-dependent enzyme [Gemmatimonadetes bacterium]|nr:aminotransferase class I/II-fold pyridoxal phosphate-dependent enzyme [Gemmatimonadota bacterium]